MPKPEISIRETRTYDANLRAVFWPGDRELAIRAARLCVLYEDLRVEYFGARELGPLPLDDLSKMYQQFYFLRRSLVTLVELCGAIQRLNEINDWQERVAKQDQDMRRRWERAVKYFAAEQKRWEPIRHSLGGHYQEASAGFAI